MMNTSETFRITEMMDFYPQLFLENFIKNESTEIPDWNGLIVHVSNAIDRVASSNRKLCAQSVKKLYGLTDYRDTDLHKKISSIARKNGINASRITSFSDLSLELTSKISEYLNFEDASNLAFTSRCHLTLQREYIINAANSGRQLNELEFTSPDKAIDFAIKFQLKSVNLIGFKSVSNNHLKRISEHLPELNQLLIRSAIITDAGLVHISKLTSLNSLDLSDCQQITDAGLEHLSKLTSLKSLDLLFCTVITGAGLEHLSKLLSLKSLGLSLNGSITEAGLAHLSKLTSLELLVLSNSEEITDAGLAHLSKLPLLESLNLSNCRKITDKGLEHLSKLHLLYSLDLSDCQQITGTGLEHLSKLISLQSLGLSFFRKIKDAGLANISKLTSLKSLDLSSCEQITDALLEHLSKLTLLQSLTLDGCDKITDAGLE
ncbi:MAG: hypothetical protein VX777_03830, partial [Chlamydiota bacterium]|nr:hypothetical protein [Chlamydiota bacterium]